MPAPASPGWELRAGSGVEHYRSEPVPGVRLIFTTHRGDISAGPCESLNLSRDVGDDLTAVVENCARLQRGVELPRLFTMNQVHSDTVLSAQPEPAGSGLPEGDACFTSRPGLALGIKVADCLPVYIYARDASCIGIAHCGWRGTAARIAEKLARQMAAEKSLALADLCFALGPCICPSCYTVGDDVVLEFGRNFQDTSSFARPAQTRKTMDNRTLTNDQEKSCVQSPSSVGRFYHLDLAAANRHLLIELGLVESLRLDLCSFENPGQLYSVRRDTATGRNLAVIVMT